MSTFVLTSLTALFVTVNPIKVAAIFAVLTKALSPGERRRVAARSVLIAAGILLIFAILGDDLLRVIGVSLAAVRVGGGILLMLLSIDIVFNRPLSPTPEGGDEATDIAVFPLATPLIAGPATITALVVQATEAGNGLLRTSLLLAVLAFVLLLTFLAFLLAARIEQWLGETGMSVIARILGILLMAVSAEMILAGIQQSGIFPAR